MTSYIGRFAPSPTGPLHLGSLVAAMGSYLDARVHEGQWLVRIEDVDRDRNVPGADQHILASLQRCGMAWDGEVTWQTRREHLYQAALAQLAEHVYPCGCSRKEIADSQYRLQARLALPPDPAPATPAIPATPAPPIYPGTCRAGLAPGKAPRALRLRTPQQPACVIGFEDRWRGHVEQDITAEVGDYVIRRADGFWAYQLAVVVDDAAQGVTDIVRGADLLDSTPRQLYLQALLGVPHPRYLHVPVVVNADGEKLSKQTGAAAFDNGAPPAQLLADSLLPAARFLGLELRAGTIPAFWSAAVPAWHNLLRDRGAL